MDLRFFLFSCDGIFKPEKASCSMSILYCGLPTMFKIPYRDLMQRIQVVFSDKSNPNDVGFTETLGFKMTYSQVCTQRLEYRNRCF